jgi:hypothetical protein
MAPEPPPSRSRAVYAWDAATGRSADGRAPGPAVHRRLAALRGERPAVASTVDWRGMRLFDLTRKTSRIAGTGAKNFNAVAITDDATGFAAITSATESGKIVYDVEVWKMEPG